MIPLIAHVIYRLDVGGLENGLVNIINRMPADRYRHTIVCLTGFEPGFRSRIHSAQVEVMSLDKRPGKDPGVYVRLWHALRHLRPEIVHTRNLGTLDQQWVAWAARVPCRIHGEHGWDASDPLGRNRRNLLIRRACRPAVQSYVAMSKDISAWLEHEVGVPRERIRQIYNGVDTDRFHPGERGECSHGDHAVAGRRLTFGTVGRLDRVKNFALLIHAFKNVLDRVPGNKGDLGLIIAGDGPLRPELERLAGELGVARQTVFAGMRNDVPAVMRSIDVFVLPSINEGISNTILEAMATGLPVIASRVGGNPELVDHGTTGLLFQSGAIEELAAHMMSYIGNRELRQAHGSHGRERARRDFSLESMVRAYLQVYDQRLAGAADATKAATVGRADDAGGR